MAFDNSALIVSASQLAVDAPEVAKLLGISRAHWLRMVSSGRAPRGVKLGARRVWVVTELRDWLEAGAPSAARWQELHGGPA